MAKEWSWAPGGLEGGGESVVVRGDERRGVDLGEEEGD